MQQMSIRPPLIPEAERHRRWLERLRQSRVETLIDDRPPESREPRASEGEPDRADRVEFYVYIACYPHNRATIHRELCHRRAVPKGERFGPFHTKEAALEQALRLNGVRGVHLCRRCKP